MSSSLKSLQLTAITDMLSLSSPWKVLIYDSHCRSLLSPLLSLAQLRQLGVTLHLLLHSDREPIPDAPALYFLQPTAENLAVVARDCSKALYQCAHVRIVSRLDREALEEMARRVVSAGGLERVASVQDRYVDFCAYEERLFGLNVEESYVLYNHPEMGEREVQEAMERVAMGLLSVVVTGGWLPVIRCQRGGATEMVARKLKKLIGEHPTLNKHTTHHRPLLVIMDRNIDLITPLQHTSTYQALVDDVLEHRANRVEFSVFPASEPSKGKAVPPQPVRKKVDIDPDTDPFYSRHKFRPFPEAIENNGSELQDVTLRERQIRSKTSGTAGTTEEDPSLDLATAVDSLPLLLERKKKLEVHTSVLQAVMNEVAARDVPQFYELETSLASGFYKNDWAKAKKDVLELVTDPSKGNVDDKVRLLIVYLLSSPAKNAEIDEVAQKMKESLETKGSTSVEGATHGTLTKQDRVRLEVGLRAMEYLKKLRSMQMIPAISDVMTMEVGGGGTGGGGMGGSSDMLSSFMARATNQATGLIAKATDRLGTIMMGKIHKHRATIVVENICEMRPNTEDDEYLYIDPRVKSDVDVVALRNTATRASAREVIVFMIGGGCYGEYQNLQMVNNERRNITYGCTEIVDPCTFLNHLGKLI